MSDRSVSLDRLIDDVARSMSAAETPALRARVVATLGRQRRASSVLVLPAAVLAGAAALAIAVHWTPAAPRVRPAATSARASAPAALAPPTLTAAQPLDTAPHAARARATTPAEPDGPGIAALPGIEAMPVSEIQPTPLDVPQLSVGPVPPVVPLSVAALDDINRDR